MKYLGNIIKIQKKCIKKTFGERYQQNQNSPEVLGLKKLFTYKSCIFMHQVYYGYAPNIFDSLFPKLQGNNRTMSFLSRAPKSVYLGKFPGCTLVKTWNNLRLGLKQTKSTTIFKKLLAKEIFSY